MSSHTQKILLGVTHARSLQLMRGLPERLVADGWEVHIVSADGPETYAYDETTVTVHRIAMERQPSVGADLSSLKSWISLLRELSPDAVFIGTPKAGLLGILASWLVGVPNRIYHLRGLRLESARGLPRLVSWLTEKFVISISTQVIAVSESLKERVTTLRLGPTRKIKILGRGSSNGVDTEHFTPKMKREISSEKLGIKPGVPVIGFVGRVTRDKGSAELSAASHLLFERGIVHQLLVVGPEDDQGALDDFASLHEENRPIFTGRVSETALYYHFMDVLCLPTHREGFPNVILEAGASGIAAVTTDATGAVDSVVDGITGLVTNVGDYRGLADALEMLLSNSQKRRAIGARAREHILKNFTREIIQKEVVSYFAAIRGGVANRNSLARPRIQE